MYSNQKGFSIIELLVAISIFTGLIFVVVLNLSNVLIGSNQGFLALSNIDQARLVSTRFVNEIRNATPGVDGSYPLNLASDSQIIFYSKSSNSSTINRIRYYISGDTLKRGVIVPTGNPQTYNLASETNSIVQNDVVNGATPLFYYYTGSYNGTSSSIPQPVNVTTVKFIKINLTVLTKTKQGSSDTFSISTGATIRNLKDNLGN